VHKGLSRQAETIDWHFACRMQVLNTRVQALLFNMCGQSPHVWLHLSTTPANQSLSWHAETISSCANSITRLGRIHKAGEASKKRLQCQYPQLTQSWYSLQGFAQLIQFSVFGCTLLDFQNKRALINREPAEVLVEVCRSSPSGPLPVDVHTTEKSSVSLTELGLW